MMDTLEAVVNERDKLGRCNPGFAQCFIPFAGWFGRDDLLQGPCPRQSVPAHWRRP